MHAVCSTKYICMCRANAYVNTCMCSAELMLYEPIGLCGKLTALQLIEGGKWMHNKAGGELFQLGGR